MGWDKSLFEDEEDFTNRGTKRPEQTSSDMLTCSFPGGMCTEFLQ
jgi:hypothetical protein